MRHSIRLLGNPDNSMQVDLRRSVSAAYYAMFHRLSGDAAAIIAPNVSQDVQHRIQRWFDHAEVKKICGRFAATKIDQPLLGLLGPSVSPDLQLFAKTFVTLQNARHDADYDLSSTFNWTETKITVESAVRALGAWSRLAGSAEANIFILSLLLWKNWERDRP